MRNTLPISDSFVKTCAGGFRFGFNGKEKTDELYGTGNAYDYGMRMYDPRLGRFMSLDPLFKKYPFYSPYMFAGDKPIRFVDLDGMEEGDKFEFLIIYHNAALQKKTAEQAVNEVNDVFFTFLSNSSSPRIRELAQGFNSVVGGATEMIGGYASEAIPSAQIRGAALFTHGAFSVGLGFANMFDATFSSHQHDIPQGIFEGVAEGITKNNNVRKYAAIGDAVLPMFLGDENPSSLNSIVGRTSAIISITNTVISDQQNSTTNTNSGLNYEIKKGDTLSGIAQQFHTTTANIAKQNNISNVNKIQAGQKLKISTN